MATTPAEVRSPVHLPAWSGPGAVAIGALGICTAAAVLNPYRGQTPPCPFHELTGLWCPICGSSRALHSLLHGDPGAAFGRNPLFIVALPLLTWAWLAWTLDSVGGPRIWRIPTRRWVLVAAVVTTAVFWVARNLPVHALRVLGP